MMAIKRTDTGSLRPQELEAVYAISKVVAEAESTEKALSEIIKLARSVFIFDNAVVYLVRSDYDILEPVFARAVGRGRSAEADLAWGEHAANEAFQTGKNFLYQAEIRPDTSRLDQDFYLGLPLVVGGQTMGALVFVRFGGPAYNEGHITVAEFIATHVTQLLEHERLVEQIANLEAEKRLAQLQEDFIATVSHELNTPLGFIKGYTTTLLRQDTKFDDAAQREFLAIIDEEADRLSDLIDNLLVSSQLQSGTMRMEFQTLQLDLLINDMLPRFRSRYNNLQIGFQAQPSKSLTVRADPKRFEQVMDNLISNASKYAPNTALNIAVAAIGDSVRVSVQDKGPGVATEHLENLFRRFYRVPERSNGVRGTGLGLYICDQIVRAHGGRIAVQSALSRGTTFHVFLPKAE